MILVLGSSCASELDYAPAHSTPPARRVHVGRCMRIVDIFKCLEINNKLDLIPEEEI